MVAETFRRDLRIGLRVLVKERSFCALAVIVLALGICGVTTMFSVVNGVMLRGFGFPNAGRLASANFIDPSAGTKIVEGMGAYCEAHHLSSVRDLVGTLAATKGLSVLDGWL